MSCQKLTDAMVPQPARAHQQTATDSLQVVSVERATKALKSHANTGKTAGRIVDNHRHSRYLNTSPLHQEQEQQR